MSLKKVAALLLLVLCVVACSDDDSSSPSYMPPIEAGEQAQNMLLLYMAADNNLSDVQQNFCQSDLREVLRAANKVPHDCYMLAFVDDKENPRLLRFFNNNGVGDYTTYNFGEEFAACDTLEMGRLFDWIEQNFPTKKMDLVFWSHATGWLYDDVYRPLQQFSFGYDLEPGLSSICSRMFVEELADFLQKRPIKPHRLMFDACFMQCAEVAYAMRNCADWIIASPAEIPGYGAPYHLLVPRFFDKTVTPQNLIDIYRDYYKDSNTGVVLSAVRCSAMQQLADATAVAVKKVLAAVDGSDCGNVFSYLPGGAFGLDYAFPNFFDMNAVMLKYLQPSDYKAWKSALDAALPYRSANEKWYSYVLDEDGGSAISSVYVSVADTWSGISMYLPNSDSRFKNFNKSFMSLEWYSAAAWNEAE